MTNSQSGHMTWSGLQHRSEPFNCPHLIQIAADVAPFGILQQPGDPFTSPQSWHKTWSGLQQSSLPLIWPHLTQSSKESELLTFDSVGFSSDLLVFGSVGPSSEGFLQPGPNITILIIVKLSKNVTTHFRDFIFTSCKSVSFIGYMPYMAKLLIATRILC